MPSGPRYWGASTWTSRTGSKPYCARDPLGRDPDDVVGESVGARACEWRKKSRSSSAVGLRARRLAAADRVGGADDHRAPRLAEDVPEPRRSARPPTRSARRTACRGRPAAAGRRRRSGRGGSRGRPPAIRLRQISSESIEASSTTIRSASIGLSSSRPGKSPGIHSSARWIVCASTPPVAWVSRRAARPVGASSASFSLRASASSAIWRVRWVLPVPGPPVTIESRRVNAPATAVALLGGQPDRARPAAAACSRPASSAPSPPASSRASARTR